QDEVAAQITALGGQVVGRFRVLASGLAAVVDASQLAAVSSVARVSAVRPVGTYQLDLSETVPFVGGAALQDMGYDGTGVKIAIIDSGVDYTHAKLGGPGTLEAYADAYCGDPGIAPDPADPACTAFDLPADPAYFPTAKVVGGYDFVGEHWTGASGSPPRTEDPNPIDFGGHGTHVADIAAGLEGGGVGPGMAPGAQVWAFKVCSAVATACNGIALLLGTDAAMDLDGDLATYDPADVINTSIGAPYGQPEDDWSWAVNQAVAYGSIYVISAGNSADKPFIVGSASTATSAVSVAETSLPSASLVLIDGAGADAYGLWQPWSGVQTGAITANLAYDSTNAGTRLGCSDANGTNPWVGTPFAGQVLLMDRGSCAISFKVANAKSAGAVLAIVANNVAQAAYEAPPSFSYGGGDASIPGYIIKLTEGNALKATSLGQPVTVDPAVGTSLSDTIVASSSRGPRNHDNYIKPDLGAPGASTSAEVGTGDGTTAFGGTSGAAPMVTGAAALLIDKYRGQALPSNIGQRFGVNGERATFMYKALLMATGNPNVYVGAPGLGAPLAPITRIGGGRLDVLRAAQSETIVWDETDAILDSRYRTGSLSFGYRAVTNQASYLRKLIIANTGSEGRWYDLSSSFRYADDAGVSLTINPPRLYVPAGDWRGVAVRLRIDAAALKAWTINKGSGGADGAALMAQEVDGYITVDGGNDANRLNVPWHVLPKRVASTRANLGRVAAQNVVQLHNTAPFQAANVDVFALVDKNPNDYGYVTFNDLPVPHGKPKGGACTSAGLDPGCNITPVDIKQVGVRGVANGAYVQFGLTIWDAPFRAGQFPVEFDIYIDANRDGADDWVVFNYDLALNGSDGRNVVWRCLPNFTGCSAFFFTDSTFNTQNWILTVPAAQIGVDPNQPFNFQVWAADGYFTGIYTDASPHDGASYHTFTLNTPKHSVSDMFPVVPAGGVTNVPFSQVANGASLSPSQVGFLLMYREAPIMRESDVVTLSH
ncbi:MAG: S8 family serine peptidase, partial [Anaerolineales bacterium]|nr:S8 family serine peptidase [Anaerolineales bacterium]